LQLSSQTKIRQSDLFLWSRTQGPAKKPFFLAYGVLVDAGKSAFHQPFIIELPVLVAIGAEPPPVRALLIKQDVAYALKPIC